MHKFLGCIRYLAFLALLVAIACARHPLEGHLCTFIKENDGFKCFSGECIPLDWVCDGQVQCPHPDESDEAFGCQLYPETGCKSWEGVKHVKCPNGNCVKNLYECDGSGSGSGSGGQPSTSDGGDKGDGEGGESKEPVNRDCPNPGGGDSGSIGFRCSDGLCVQKRLACDGIKQCKDGSDESKFFAVDIGRYEKKDVKIFLFHFLAIGCNLFPAEDCPSWFGEKHVKCPIYGPNGTVTGVEVCTQEKYSFTGECRRCDAANATRCDNGQCVPDIKWQNGLKDCADGSDEDIYVIRWWWLFLITLLLAVAGISMSFGCRFAQNNCFQCGLCSSARSKRLQQMRRDAEKPAGLNDNACCDESPTDGEYKECAVFYLPVFELARILEDGHNWRKQILVSQRTELKGKYAYGKIHQDPVLYRTLYAYLVHRLASPRELARAMDQLFRWEKEFHCETALDAFACWRLHLGSTRVLKKVYNSVQPPGFLHRFKDKYQPVKDHLRRVRQTLPREIKEPSERVYAIINIAIYLLKPFVDTAAFYFDIAKDVAFTTIVYTSLRDLVSSTYKRIF